jgi:hypothetical protein
LHVARAGRSIPAGRVVGHVGLRLQLAAINGQKSWFVQQSAASAALGIALTVLRRLAVAVGASWTLGDGLELGHRSGDKSAILPSWVLSWSSFHNYYQDITLKHESIDGTEGPCRYQDNLSSGVV